MHLLNRFKDTPVYIERPPALEEAIPAQIRDIQLPQKMVAQLNQIDPFDDEVLNQVVVH